MKKLINYFPAVVAYFFIFLFCYAGVSKMRDFENFQVQIAQSPLLSAYAGFISYATIISEVVIVLLLVIPKLRTIGLYASLGIMSSFTVYIYLILHYSDFVPCSCGGILEKMGWTEHLIFNIVCVMAAILAILIIAKYRQNVLVGPSLSILCIIAIFSSIVTYLFYSSEHIIKEKNNFIRRFPQHPIIEEKSYDLKYNSYYFAGATNGRIYLGNPTSPFVLLAIDRDLAKVDTIRLVPDQLHTFHAVRSLVTDKYLYMYDGIVPAIYRSEPNDFSGKINQISFQDVYFDQLAAIGPDSFVLRTQSNTTGGLILGSLNLKSKEKVKLYPNILEKQVDGIFDVDGKLHYDEYGGKIWYVYSYRNQALGTSRNLENIDKIKTIDTVSISKIRVVQLKDGRKKMSAPPVVLNPNSFAHRGLLFIQSGTMGRYESRDLWNKNDIVDVYDTESSKYWGSFYVQRRGSKKMSQLLVTDQYLFVLAGKQITSYRIAQTLARNFKHGESRKPDQSRHNKQ
ncbi:MULTISPECIES: DoxX family protein [Chryseobacterium]|uniref:Methylamine utilisation protein MauE domain-containing protein n=2 Tax=Chryseobacterium gleum TaxID=250 RepID=A0A3S4MAR5_CHRGE|nr:MULTISPECIES: MauE/DoxX family redox-associated membrane protein [Chryseobacterium]ASE61656.1 hypothetical protein CEQ15_09195 [Chryseobacterium indologenes]AZB32284.1 hypothetical protein EG351_00610 [Chryseobacterium bernardetii]EFK33965.1 hypothetical protein HMPREF0204_13034 [Chryseobacterium gleum ATCC 35910]MDG4654166.1 hypothetical protein [Chryseobacterium arthrosphaerae]QQY29865.1 hypothetical protein I6I60_13330 [Chryseobacterium gleum]